VGNFNTPFSPIDRPSRQKINKETSELNNLVDQMDLTDDKIFYTHSSQQPMDSSLK
jgi:hypothetical protein